MELDELKQAWRELDQRLESSEVRIGRALREFKLDKTRFALRRHTAVLGFELLFDVAALWLIGRFVVEEFGNARFVLPALALALGILASIVAIVVQLEAGRSIDYAAPVIEIQRKIRVIRALRVRSTQWILLLSPLMWTPLVIVAARSFLGLDIYSVLGATFVACNLSVGLAVIPLGIQGARICAARLEHSPLLKALADSVAGHSLTRATESILELEQFEQE